MADARREAELRDVRRGYGAMAEICAVSRTGRPSAANARVGSGSRESTSLMPLVVAAVLGRVEVEAASRCRRVDVEVGDERVRPHLRRNGNGGRIVASTTVGGKSPALPPPVPGPLPRPFPVPCRSRRRHHCPARAGATVAAGLRQHR